MLCKDLPLHSKPFNHDCVYICKEEVDYLSSKPKKESFEWVIKPTDIPTKNLAKIVAKTTVSTDHRKDMTLPPEDRVIRQFSPQEIEEASRSLAERVIGYNHQRVIDGAVVLDSQWNEMEQALECLAYLPTEYINKVKEGKIKKVSVEFNHREEIKNGDTVEYKGLVFNRVDLLEGRIAGDLGTQITLFESNGGAIEGEITIQKEVLGEPFAGYTDFADCVAKNQDKDKPDAYCGSIQAQTEGKTLEECKEIIDKIPFTLKKKESVPPITPPEPLKPAEKKPEEIILEKDKRITELETAVATATAATQTLKTEHDKKVADAKQEGKKEVLDKIKAKIPPQFIENHFGGGAKRFVEEVKKVVHEESE